MASILLIDDDDDLRMVMAEVLRSAGYTVDIAGDGKTGLALYSTRLHDLVITDIVMPDMAHFDRLIWPTCISTFYVILVGVQTPASQNPTSKTDYQRNDPPNQNQP